MNLLGTGPDPATDGGGRDGPVDAICSARGCRLPAVWAVRWNNPALHTPERRKIWTACDDHRGTLSDFLSLRGFLRDVVPLADLAGPTQPRGDHARFPPTAEGDA